MQPDINQMLGEAPTPEEENPLEKINEAAKASSKKKDISKQSLEIDEGIVRQMLMTGENSDGLFTPNENKEEESKDPKHAEVHEDAKVKQTKVSAPKGKYTEKFLQDITKNPQEYKVNTPKGEMTIAEAIRKGYNPITKRFEKNRNPKEIKKKHMKGLNEQDKQKLEELMNPASAHLAPKDAESLGLPANSPMVDNGQALPTVPAAIPQQAAPTETPTPQEGVDINALLGGVK